MFGDNSNQNQPNSPQEGLPRRSPKSFDAQAQAENTPPGTSPLAPPPASPQPAVPPSNLPTAEPSLSEQQPEPPRPPQSFEPPEDILESVDIPETPAATRGPDIPPPEIPDLAEPVEHDETEPVKKSKRTKVIILTIIVILGLTVLAAAGWYGYQLFTQSETPSPQPASSDQVPQQPATTTPGSANQNAGLGNQQPTQSAPTQQAPQQPVDTDRDGLSDEDEALYGTNPELVDTDDDGLTDRDEVVVFKTDPLNPDTDGDGFTDGDEVRNGYDPKGPGRLLELP
ncbi:MAG TPA: hypothetical protein VGA08_03995 [Candidatus Saccharimonadales bacterium]|jgi:hypothetical protein